MSKQQHRLCRDPADNRHLSLPAQIDQGNERHHKHDIYAIRNLHNDDGDEEAQGVVAVGEARDGMRKQ